MEAMQKLLEAWGNCFGAMRVAHSLFESELKSKFDVTLSQVAKAGAADAGGYDRAQLTVGALHVLRQLQPKLEEVPAMEMQALKTWDEAVKQYWKVVWEVFPEQRARKEKTCPTCGGAMPAKQLDEKVSEAG